ncbi:MAG TPA: RNA-binding domain-containing protein [Thermoanaerobaculia bacterium]|jgi:ATP-dependent DNA helicase RecG|nr:RNA-binding domain-containing protein [Thermoanaerobaculia bacterium]
MLLTELQEVIRNGENSGVEFKRADVEARKVAKEIAALANLEGGHVLLGVDDDGNVTGLSRSVSETEEWVMNLCRDSVIPPMIPFWESVVWDSVAGTRVGVITIPENAPDKPYKARQGGHAITMIRVGTTSREATREEEARLYQASGMFRYELRQVPGTSLADLDIGRIRQYFITIRQQDAPQMEARAEWEDLLVNVELMARHDGRAIPTVAGMILFGSSARKFLPQSGIRAVAYQGTDKSYAAAEDTLITGPLLPLLRDGEIESSGVIDGCLEFARRHLRVQSRIDDSGRREDTWSIPLDVLREAVVNAVAHRDYSLTGMDIEVNVYSDSVEVISPGRLPNGISVPSMIVGCRASRNEIIKETLRDYRFVDARGLGVPRKLVAGMRQFNDSQPDLAEEEQRFVVRLLRTS